MSRFKVACHVPAELSSNFFQFQAKNEVEKSKRKIEGDLRVSQEAVAELERNKAELAQSIQRKEREFGAIIAKIEDEASLGTKQQKQIKELAVSDSHTVLKWPK